MWREPIILQPANECLLLVQILSLQFRVTIDDKIVGEVTQDIANLDKNADFLVPVQLDLNVTPAVVQVRLISYF